MRFIMVIVVLLFLVGCQRGPAKLNLAGQEIDSVYWSEEEKAKDFAIRAVFNDDDSSSVLMRMQASEPPHYHDRHGLAVTVVSGRAAINFSDRRVELNPGDIVVIPKGTYHWAESLDDKPSVVFVVFSPPFDGKDRRVVKSIDK